MFKQKACFCVVLFLFCSSLANASEEHKIGARDTLGGISAKYYKKSELTRYQLYVGLLVKNPHAFSSGNINYLKKNEVMIIPDLNDLKVMPEKEAVALVNKHESLARSGDKTQLEAPFKVDDVSQQESVDATIEKQETVTKRLEELDQETEKLKEQLNAISKRNDEKDQEIRELDKLLGK